MNLVTDNTKTGVVRLRTIQGQSENLVDQSGALTTGYRAANGYHRSGPGRELTLAYEQGSDETKSFSFPLAMESRDAGPPLPPLAQRLTEHPRGKTQLVFLVGDPELSLQC